MKELITCTISFSVIVISLELSVGIEYIGERLNEIHCMLARFVPCQAFGASVHIVCIVRMGIFGFCSAKASASNGMAAWSASLISLPSLLIDMWVCLSSKALSPLMFSLLLDRASPRVQMPPWELICPWISHTSFTSQWMFPDPVGFLVFSKL